MHKMRIWLLIHAIVLTLFSTSAFCSEATECVIGKGRPIKFTTTEGSEMNLDVSPDGRWLVFDMLGDIYVLPAKGGAARRITSGHAWDSRPVWSPRGDLIAFLSDRAGDDQVFVVDMPEHSTPRQVTFQGELGSTRESRLRTLEGGLAYFEWMPDGTSIMAAGKIFSADRRNSTVSPMPLKLDGEIYYGTSKGLYYFTPAVSQSTTPPPPGVSTKLLYDAWVLDAPSKVRRIPSLDTALDWGFEPPAVSANGRWVVYRETHPIASFDKATVSRGTLAGATSVKVLSVLDAAAKTSRILVGPTFQESANQDAQWDKVGLSSETRFAISPDSKSLFAAYRGQVHRVDLETGKDTIVAMSADVDQCLESRADTKISIDNGDLRVRNMRYISKRADGNQLLFSALRRIYVQDTSGGVPKVLYHQEEGQFEPAYSPNGRWIAFVTWSDARGGQVWRARSDGSDAQQLTHVAGYYQSPTWSPDGKTIAFIGSKDLETKRNGYETYFYNGTISLIEPGTLTLRDLPQAVRLGTQLTFSGDGKDLFYTPYIQSDATIGAGFSTRDRVRLNAVSLNAVRLDGAVNQEVLPGTYFTKPGINSAAMSPDGSTVAVVYFGNLFVVSCPTEGPKRDRLRSARCTKIQVTRSGGKDPKWQDNGRALEWSFGDTYYRAQLSDLLKYVGPDSSRSVATDRLQAAGRLKISHVKLSVPRLRSSMVTVLQGARVITMRGDEVIENGTIIIKDGRIDQVGSIGQVPVPNGAHLIDVAGKTIMPGLIDAHAHFSELPRDLLAKNYSDALLSLAFGVTTIKDPSNGGDHEFSYAELVEAGDMTGPRMFSAFGFVSEAIEINSFDDALNVAERYKRLGATFLKYHTGFNRIQRRWIMDSAKLLDLNVASHLPANNYITDTLNVSTIFDGATTSEHEFSAPAEIYRDMRQFVVQSGVLVCLAGLGDSGGNLSYLSSYWNTISQDQRIKNFYVGESPNPTLVEMLQDEGALLPLQAEQAVIGNFAAELTRDNDQVVELGSHGNHDGIGMHTEMWAHVASGMTPHQVLRAATLNGARGLGLEDELGSIEPGKVADIIVLDRNPLEDIRNTISVEMVVKDGIARDASSLAELWPNPRPLPEWRAPSAQGQPAPAKEPASHIH